MKILVGYDGSDLSHQALNEAIDLAEQFKGTILVLSVFWDETESEKNQILLRAEKRLMETFVKYDIVSESSKSPPSRIGRMAKEEGVDLIAIGSKGRGGAKAWVLGSTSSKVIEEAPCPILVIK
jgi:nucleotide-binding universal stress UspA family protein